MTQPIISTSELESLTDIDWFDNMCRILTKDKCPSTIQLAEVIGIEDSRFSKEKRGSKFLVPFDRRFKTACINPDLLYNDADKPIDYLSFGGTDFNLKMIDIIQRFPDYKTQLNIYDGGTQIFFYPIPKQFEFSALSFDTDKEPEDIGDINSLAFHHVTFQFGDNVFVGRDGYNMRRLNGANIRVGSNLR
ncbi:MAG TPA: hypothetical protein VIJ95_12260 [Hanamia sp.]